MTTGGWLILILSVGTVTLLFGWCLYKVLSTPEEADHLHGFEMDTPDSKESRQNQQQQG